jgi:hypothetical protein
MNLDFFLLKDLIRMGKRSQKQPQTSRVFHTTFITFLYRDDMVRIGKKMVRVLNEKKSWGTCITL